MKHRKTFMEVLCNCDDQVIVRHFLEMLVPQETKLKIVDLFNLEVDRRNALEAEDYPMNPDNVVSCERSDDV